LPANVFLSAFSPPLVPPTPSVQGAIYSKNGGVTAPLNPARLNQSISFTQG